MIPRSTTGKGVTGAIRYVLGEGKDPDTKKHRTKPKGDRSRVEWFGGTGFGFEIETRADADLARRLMEFAALNQASKTRKCEKDCYHLSLSWKPGEEPTREQMEQAAHQALAALGMSNAQAMFVAHNDEKYAHVHIIASKINPATGKAYDLTDEHLKLSRWAEKYERDFSGGIVCTARAENNQLREAVARRDVAAILDLATQQAATFKTDALERMLEKQIPRDLERGQFLQKILNHPDVVQLSDEIGGQTTRYTTKAVLEAEGQAMRAAAGLARNDRHAASAAALQSVLDRPQFEGMSEQQAKAVQHVTASGGLALIDGQAGTGKSYTMNAVRQVYERDGYHVVGLAFKNDIAASMRESGFQHGGTIHSELFKLNNGLTTWDDRTLIVVDEAAMVDSKLMAQVTTRAFEAGAKLILIGDDRQLSSIERGGMFTALRDHHGAAELTEVRRQTNLNDRRASELMAEGNFHDALAMYDAKGAIKWTRNQDEAREALVSQWAKDSAADPSKSRLVVAYTNEDVNRLNADLRAVRIERGELGSENRTIETKHGPAEFSTGDRIQITGTDKKLGLTNGAVGTIKEMEGRAIVVQLDGRDGKLVEFDQQKFKDFRHGYAGTIHAGQGRSIDQVYLYHSAHWRSAASYVALTRHRDKAELYVATNTAKNLKSLARQMGRTDERRAASHFHQQGMPEPVRPITAAELANVPLLPDQKPQQQAKPRISVRADMAPSPIAAPIAIEPRPPIKVTARFAPTPPAASHRIEAAASPRHTPKAPKKQKVWTLTGQPVSWAIGSRMTTQAGAANRAIRRGMPGLTPYTPEAHQKPTAAGPQTPQQAPAAPTQPPHGVAPTPTAAPQKPITLTANQVAERFGDAYLQRLYNEQAKRKPDTTPDQRSQVERGTVPGQSRGSPIREAKDSAAVRAAKRDALTVDPSERDHDRDHSNQGGRTRGRSRTR